MMNNMYLIILSLFALTSCGETAKSDVSKKTTDKPKTEQTIVNDGIPYVNGLSVKNNGDKMYTSPLTD